MGTQSFSKAGCTNPVLAARRILAIAAAALFVSSASASVVLNPNSPAAGQHTIVLDPVTFTVTANGRLGLIVFEDFFSSNASGNGTNVGSSTLTASVNGGAAFALNTITNNGIFASTAGLLDPNDLFINIATASEFIVSVGQSITIQGTTTFSGTLPSFNANFAQVGQLADESAGVTALSAQTSLGAAVPEPSALALVGLGLLGVAVSRRKTAG